MTNAKQNTDEELEKEIKKIDKTKLEYKDTIKEFWVDVGHHSYRFNISYIYLLNLFLDYVKKRKL